MTDSTDDVTFPNAETPAAPAAEPAEGTQPVEHWAELKGLLPAVLGPADKLRPNPDYWKFAGAKAFRGWASGAFVTEEDFDKAVDEQSKLVAR